MESASYHRPIPDKQEEPMNDLRPEGNEIALTQRLRGAPHSLLNLGPKAESWMREAADKIESDAKVIAVLMVVLAEIERLGWKEGLGAEHAIASHYAIRKVVRKALATFEQTKP
jgi:hypothetical protein